MGADRAYDRHICDAAEADLALAAFGAALTWTERAGAGKRPQFSDLRAEIIHIHW